MGSSNTTSTTVVKKLPDYCQPYAENMLSRANVLADVSYVAYSSTTFATQDANELAGIAALALRGRNGNTTIAKGIAYIQDILDGIYLAGTDSFFLATLVLFHDNLSTAFTSNVLVLLGGSSFCMGDLEHANLAQTLCAGTVTKYSGRGQAKLTSDNYKAARTDQHQALSVGIEFAGQSIRDAETLRGSGLYQREYEQARLTDLFNKWVDGQVWRVNKLEILGNSIRALVGAQITKTEPFYRPSPMLSIGGGAISGAATGAMVGGGYGAIVGGVAGAVLGFASSR